MQIEILFPFAAGTLVACEVGEEVQGGHAILGAAPDIHLLTDVVLVLKYGRVCHIAVDVAVIDAVVELCVGFVDGAEEAEVLAVCNFSCELDDAVAMLDVAFVAVVAYKAAAVVGAGHFALGIAVADFEGALECGVVVSDKQAAPFMADIDGHPFCVGNIYGRIRHCSDQTSHFGDTVHGCCFYAAVHELGVQCRSAEHADIVSAGDGAGGDINAVYFGMYAGLSLDVSEQADTFHA